MGNLPPATFSSLLRRYRQAAGLTQEELAERARLSVQAIGALERGDRRSPRKETINLLAEALSLTEPERAVFEATARQRRQADLAAPGDVSRADLTSPSHTDEDVNAPKIVLSQYEMWSILHPVTERSLTSRSGRKLSGSMVSVLLIVLVGSALLLQGEPGGGTLTRLCGGALALATDFPTGGEDGSITGKPEENAANLAVLQNQNLGSGYTLKTVNYDDVSPQTGDFDPSTGASNVKQLVHNPCILGMVGPLNSKVAPMEMPIAANAGLAMISPGVTNPALTLRPFAATQGLNFDQLHPSGKPINFFRIVPNDAAQVVADADLTFDLGAKRVYVVNNSGSYGQELVGGFTPAFEEKGGKVVGIDGIGLDPSVIPNIAAKIVAAKPDAVFYGGLTSSGAGLLKGDLVNLGYRGFFVGGDGIANDPDFLKQAGTDAANGTYASVGGRDPSTFTSGAAAQFIRDYSARYPGQDPSFYSADAFDAAMVLITAIKHLIVAGQAVTRAALIDQVQHIQYAGATGPISFDSNGDIAHGVYSIYAVQNGMWAYAWQVNV